MAAEHTYDPLARAAAQWNDTGAGLSQLASECSLPPEAALAVWMVEAGDLPFVPGRPALRFECHKLWEHWGQDHATAFDAHFRFGGRQGVAGSPWTNHQICPPGGAQWRSFHGAQDSEYNAFELAVSLAGEEMACLASSFGGPQILGSNHGILGYRSAAALYRAFGESQEAQIRGFFDFCQHHGLIVALKHRDWLTFARVYNGPGQAAAYADHINDAWLAAKAFLWNVAPHPSIVERARFDFSGFAAFVKELGLKHFSARELLFRGRNHADPRHPAHAQNGFPAKQLWPNITDAARALDTFRAHIGVPIVIAGAFRTPIYNERMNGSPHSQHLRFAAIDFEVRSERPASYWGEKLRKLRNKGLFAGAVGLHGPAIHLDARGQNIDF